MHRVLLTLVPLLAGCNKSVFTSVADTPTLRERTYDWTKHYEEVDYTRVNCGDEDQRYFVRKSGDQSPGVTDAFESTRLTTAENKPVFIGGDRHFVVDPWLYCRNLEQHAARVSSQWAAIGIPAAAIGLSSAVVGTALTVDEATDDTPNGGVLFGRAALAAGGYLLSFLGIYAFERSNAASDASVQASRGLKEADREKAYQACIEARSTWVSTRTSAIDKLREEQQRLRKDLEKQREQSETTQLDSAGTPAPPTTASATAPSVGPVPADDVLSRSRNSPAEQTSAPTAPTPPP